SAGLGVEGCHHSGDFQLRPGRAVHQRRIHGPIEGSRDQDQHGWTGTRTGQCVRRTFVALREMGRSLFERLQRRGRRDPKLVAILSFLQSRKTASIVEQRDASSGLLWSQKGCRFAAQCLISFKRHGEIYPSDGSADPKTGASAHRSDEFPAGYSSAGCSSAEPACASPAVAQYAAALWRRSISFFRSAYSLIKNIGSGSTLANLFFCPKDGVHLRPPQNPTR